MAPTVAAQAEALERALPKGWRAFHAVHGGRPSIAAALASARAAGVERLVVIPMRPEFSLGVSGDELAALYEALRRRGGDLHVEVRSWWHDDAAYIDAHARVVHACAASRGLSPLNAVLVFLGDAGADAEEVERLRECAELLRVRLGWPVDRAATLVDGGTRGETLRGALETLAVDERTPVLVCPIAHMAPSAALTALIDRVVTPYHEAAVGPVHVCPPPADAPEFIKALSLLVRRGRQPAGADRASPPLFAELDPRAAVLNDVDSLMMAGVCVQCTLGRIGGPTLRFATHDELKGLKRPHMETVAMLHRLGERGVFRECWVWNTCSRYELYAWARPGTTADERRAALEAAATEAFGPDAIGRINLLSGREAWHHAMRTAAGLNSALVGDAEVVEQLQAARCAAQLAGTAGSLTDAMIQDIAHGVRDLRSTTGWSRFAHRYCDVALSRLAPRIGEVLAGGRCLVIGGSTTSCSVLETLAERFNVPQDRMRLIYRGFRKGTLVKRLHAAVGESRIAVVDDYADKAVLKAISAADVVFFALDQRNGVVSADQLAGCRDLDGRPLTVVDFNTFGSVGETGPVSGLTLIDAARIDAEVSGFNAEALRDAGLASAVAEAERWIQSHISDGPAQPAGRSKAARPGREVAV